MIEKGRYQGMEVTNRTCEQCDLHGLKMNAISFSSAQNMVIYDRNTYHAIL